MKYIYRYSQLPKVEEQIKRNKETRNNKKDTWRK